jgi:hypothetical protein
MRRSGKPARPPRVACLAVLLAIACTDPFGDAFSLSKSQPPAPHALRLGDRFPEGGEIATIGPLLERIARGSPDFARLVRCDGPDLVFKDEEGTGADRMMTRRLCARLHRLAPLVDGEWPGLRPRVTEAWDERAEHGANSVHYEGRAADLTTSDVDPRKLGRLARLAVDAGLDWVFFEDGSHVHASVRR